MCVCGGVFFFFFGGGGGGGGMPGKCPCIVSNIGGDWMVSGKWVSSSLLRDAEKT